MSLLIEIFGPSTIFSNGMLSIPLENFSCPLTKRHLAAAIIGKIYDRYNGIVSDADNALLVDEWGTPLGWSEEGLYGTKRQKSFVGSCLKITYDIQFVD